MGGLDSRVPCCLHVVLIFLKNHNFGPGSTFLTGKGGFFSKKKPLNGRFLDLSRDKKNGPFSLNDPTDDFSAWNTNAVLPRKKDVETGIPRAKTCPLKCTSCLLEPVLVVETTNKR